MKRLSEEVKFGLIGTILFVIGFTLACFVGVCFALIAKQMTGSYEVIITTGFIGYVVVVISIAIVCFLRSKKENSQKDTRE